MQAETDFEIPPKSDEPVDKGYKSNPKEFEEVPQIVEHLSKSVNFTPFDTRWVPCSAKFVLLGINPRGTGAFKIYEMNHGSLDLIAEVWRSSSR